MEDTTVIHFVNSASQEYFGTSSMLTFNESGGSLFEDAANESMMATTANLSTCPNFGNQKTWLTIMRFSLSGVFLTIVCIIGACSNLAAFFVLFSSKKFNQSVYIYMKCLAFNDCIMLCTFLVFALYALTFLPSTPPAAYVAATNAFVSIFRFWYALAIMCQGQSIWFMTLITLDRCCALSSNYTIRDAVCRKTVSILLSSMSVGIWFAFFVLNCFNNTFGFPFCIYPGADEHLVMFMYLQTEFSMKSWLFRVTFTIIMKFIVPVVLTVTCISYMTAILIHTISSKAGKSQHLPTASFRRHPHSSIYNPTGSNRASIRNVLRSSRRKPKLVDTDANQERADGRHSSLSPQASTISAVHGRNLRSRIQTAHALSWAIAASMIFCHLPCASMLLIKELTGPKYASDNWFLISNEIANVLISSSSAINFLLFFFSGNKYRAEMNRLLAKFKRKFSRKSTPPARLRCYNYEPHQVHVSMGTNHRQPLIHGTTQPIFDDLAPLDEAQLAPPNADFLKENTPDDLL